LDRNLLTTIAMEITARNIESHALRILENMSGVVMLFDPDLILQYLNPSAEMLFQISARHMLGLHAADLIKCEERNVIDHFRQALESGYPFTEREVALPLPDRRTVTVDCTVIPLSDPDGDYGLLLEIQQIDRQLRITREDQILTQHQAVRDLIRGVAHEVKNPLGGLRGAAQLLEQELPDPSLREYTQIIIAEADRLQSLVNRMLGPNKLPQLREVNIHVMLERVYQLVLVESGLRIEIVRDYDPSIPDLYVDSDRIIQSLLNIVRNAARALEGQADGVLTLRTRVLRQFTIGYVRHRLVAKITVEDNGPGVPESIRETLFYPMVSASENGAGLGLSIAQSLINQHGGLVECDSRPGKTRFNVLLPVERANGKG